MARKAAIPPTGLIFPLQIVGDGLLVRWRPDGLRQGYRTIDLATWPGSLVLRQEIAAAIALKVGPTGAWTSAAGMASKLADVKRFLAWCNGQGIATFADFTEQSWDDWVTHLGSATLSENRVKVLQVSARVLLRDVANLPKRTRWAVSRRVGNPVTPIQSSYSASEFRALERAAHRAIAKAHLRISVNWALASGEPNEVKEADRERARMLRLIIEGRAPAGRVIAKALGPVSGKVATKNPLCKHHLVFTPEEALAAAVLLTCKQGYNISTLCRLEVADPTAGLGEVDRDVYTVHNDKPRRGPRRHFTSVLEDDGTESSGRAYRLVEEATHPTRHYAAQVGHPTTLLLLYATAGGWKDDDGHGVAPGILAGVPVSREGSASQQAEWLPPGLVVDFRKLHRTYQTIIFPSSTHNTRSTHISSYLLLNKEARALARATAATGLQQALIRAEKGHLVRLSTQEEVSAQIASGAQDTATVACRDVHHHPLTGQECQDSFLLCLMCVNAVATPRHLPRLALLHRALEDLRSTLTARAWGRWQDDYLRLHAFLYQRAKLTPERYASSLAAATETDKTHVRQLLGGIYDITD